MKKTVKDLTELENLAGDFLKKLKKGKKATILALSGDLGSGKTAFTQMIARKLGLRAKVTSPTFVLQKKYKLPPSGSKELLASYKQLIHIDAYRLNAGRDLLALDWAEIAADPDNLIVVEWPEIVKDIIPDDCQRLNFKFIDDQTREVTI